MDYATVQRVTLQNMNKLNDRLNTTEAAADLKGYKIRGTDLSIIFQRQFATTPVEDTLLLLIEALFSATEVINKGGKATREPVEVFTHLHGKVQMQIVGHYGRLTYFKCAQIFQGLAVVGEQIGYYQSTL
ncbi:MAG: hypothetical protein Q9222_007461, partial [Ikaeria aurantiellina]